MLEIRLSQGWWIPLIRRLMGIILQFLPLKVVLVGQANAVVKADAEGESTRRAAGVGVTRWDAQREGPERKFHFDFEMSERGALEEKFRRKYPAMRKSLHERRELENWMGKLGSQGLGRNHPAVAVTAKRLIPLEEEIVMNWKAFRADRRGSRPKD